MAASVKYLLIWINIGSIVAAGYRHYVMDSSVCGSVLSLDHERIYGATFTQNLTSSSPAQGHCVVTLIRSTSSYSHLHFYISEFVTNVTDCSKYSVAVRVGDWINTMQPHSVIPQVCESSLNKVSATSWREYLQFVFTWNTTVPDSYIQIVVNAFSTDSCLDDDDESQTECDNGYCIPSALKCQGRNPCVDYSDCTDRDDEMSYTVRILYTVGSVLCFIFVMTIIYNICFKTKWSERCKCEDGCCCLDFCAYICVGLRDCFGACFSGIKKSGAKLKGCCCGMCCKNTVSTGRSTGNTPHATERPPPRPREGEVPLPPYSFRALSPPPTYSVAMRNDAPPEYSEVFSISIEPTLEPPPDYETVHGNGGSETDRHV